MRGLHKYSRNIRKEWTKTKAVFTNKDLLIKNYQVMQRWEDNYMESLAAIVTSGGGNILEVGFGLGISAGYIQKSKNINSHTIIECHPDVIEFACNKFPIQLASGRMKLYEGFWEDITPKFPNESFDGILFDSCPLDSDVEFFHFFNFFKEACRLLKNDGIFAYFSDEAQEISKIHIKKLKESGFKSIEHKICKVCPPKTCKYWEHNTIVLPIIKKRI